MPLPKGPPPKSPAPSRMTAKQAVAAFLARADAAAALPDGSQYRDRLMAEAAVFGLAAWVRLAMEPPPRRARQRKRKRRPSWKAV